DHCACEQLLERLRAPAKRRITIALTNFSVLAGIMKYAAPLAPIFLLSFVGFASAGLAAQTPPAAKTASVLATAADIKAGAQVRDSKGVQVAKIVEMQGGNVVLDTGQTKI